MIPESEPVLVVTIPNHSPRCYRFEGVQIQVGRGGNNHLIIDEQAVSKVHCEFINDTNLNRWIFRDLGSTNGSKLNGQVVVWDALPVSDGDEIILGNVIKLLFLSVHEFENPDSLENEEEEDPDVNPVAAAVARQSRDEMESTQLIKIKPGPRRRR